MKKIMFFDLNIIGIGRYPLQIANEIIKEDDEVYFYFLYEEDPDNKLEEIVAKLPKNSEVIKIKKPNYNYLKNLMQNISPESFLVMAQRIPDNALVSIANKLNIQTFKFQHGLYIPFMKRDISMFISKMVKTLRYIQYALVVAQATKYNKIEMIKEYINIFLKGKKITDTNFPLEKINAKTVFVYGDYWKEYHKEEYGYILEQQIVVGYPDLAQLDSIKRKPQENAVCYICQTLVEDGRLPREQMIDFVELLAKSIGDTKLYMKLHPRSDMTLYKALQNKKNVVFSKTDFPHVTKYIGHYSSMLAIAMYLTDEVFLWEFEGHNEYPFYLVDNAKVISTYKKELNKFLVNDSPTNSNNNNIHFYFANKNTFALITKKLLGK